MADSFTKQALASPLLGRQFVPINMDTNPSAATKGYPRGTRLQSIAVDALVRLRVERIPLAAAGAEPMIVSLQVCALLLTASGSLHLQLYA